MAEVTLKDVVNSLGPNDAICWQRSGSTLAQVMACCLTTPSHYLNQCWLSIRKVQWYSYEDNFRSDISPITEISLKIIYTKFHWNLPGANELKSIFSKPKQNTTKDKLCAYFLRCTVYSICIKATYCKKRASLACVFMYSGPRMWPPSVPVLGARGKQNTVRATELSPTPAQITVFFSK